jgi:hypothetical protein
MGLEKQEVESLMAQRSKKDLEFMRNAIGPSDPNL